LDSLEDLVKYWSNTGQILVKYWSNAGRIPWRTLSDTHTPLLRLPWLHASSTSPPSPYHCKESSPAGCSPFACCFGIGSGPGRLKYCRELTVLPATATPRHNLSKHSLLTPRTVGSSTPCFNITSCLKQSFRFQGGWWCWFHREAKRCVRMCVCACACVRICVGG
jgi:hypothetical protein